MLWKLAKSIGHCGSSYKTSLIRSFTFCWHGTSPRPTAPPVPAGNPLPAPPSVLDQVCVCVHRSLKSSRLGTARDKHRFPFVLVGSSLSLLCQFHTQLSFLTAGRLDPDPTSDAKATACKRLCHECPQLYVAIVTPYSR